MEKETVEQNKTPKSIKFYPNLFYERKAAGQV